MHVVADVFANLDSPGIPPSANTHQLFRGFSFVATSQSQEPSVANVPPSRPEGNTINPLAQVHIATPEHSQSMRPNKIISHVCL